MKRSFIKSGFWLLLVVTAIGIVVIGCPNALAPPSRTGGESSITGNIKGKVTHATTGNPIEGVNITTDPPTNDTKTDSKGAYAIVDVDPGVYAITASKTGYKSGNANVSVEVGEDTIANIVLALTAASIIEVTPNPVTVTSGSTQQFIAAGKDINDNDVPITPTWSVMGGIGTISPSGLFSAITAGTGDVVATSLGVSGSSDVTVIPGKATSIELYSGDGQSDRAGATLADPFVVIVKDSNENPVSGVSVSFSVAAGGGVLSETLVVTGSNGKAFVILTLGTTPGTNTVTATATGLGGSSVTFNAAGGGPLASLEVTPNPVTIASGDTQQFMVLGKDANGTVISITPTWSVTGGIGSITTGGLFSAVTLGNGTVVATSEDISGSSNITVTFGPVSSTNSTVVAFPTSVKADGVSTSAVTVALKDANNNLVSGHNATISSGTYPTTITPSSGMTDSSGQVVFKVNSAQEGTANITATDTTESVVIDSTASIVFTEITPPTNVENFTAIAGNGKIFLSWMNPSATNPINFDFAGVKIIQTGSNPPSPTDGTEVYDSTGTSYTDTGLTNGTTYFYTAFAYDEVANYASGAQDSTTPTSDNKLKWSYTTEGDVKSSPAIDSDGTIYVGSDDGKLYAINPDGTLKWSYTSGGDIESSPAIGSEVLSISGRMITGSMQ